MKPVVFPRCSSFFSGNKNTMELWQKGFGFLDNCISIGWDKFSLILREYFSKVALLSYCFMILRWIEIENVYLSQMWNPRTVC